MNVLCACECSGIVRDEFRAKGHNAWSCDLKPCEKGEQWHLQCDVWQAIAGYAWDVVIAFPPCTHLASSGARHFTDKRADGRQQAAVEFFLRFTALPMRWCIENPVGIMSKIYRRPDQYIQPWQFGHCESKKTCLWLNGLPVLQPTKIVEPRYVIGKDGKRYSPTHYASGHSGKPPAYLSRLDAIYRKRGFKPIFDNQTPSGQNRLSPSPQRATTRARTYPGIAAAMAAQWGAL